MPADHLHSPIKLVNTASPPQDTPALNACPLAAAAPSAPQPASPAPEAARPASIEGTQASPTKPLAPMGAQLRAPSSVHALTEVQADCTPTANTLALDAFNSGTVTIHNPSSSSATANHAHAAQTKGRRSPLQLLFQIPAPIQRVRRSRRSTRSQTLRRPPRLPHWTINCIMP